MEFSLFIWETNRHELLLQTGVGRVRRKGYLKKKKHNQKKNS